MRRPLRHHAPCVPAVFAVLLLPALSAAQTPEVITLAEHQRRLPLLRERVDACLQHADRCTSADIADERFPLANGVSTHVSYLWLRHGIDALGKTPQTVPMANEQPPAGTDQANAPQPVPSQPVSAQPVPSQTGGTQKGSVQPPPKPEDRATLGALLLARLQSGTGEAVASTGPQAGARAQANQVLSQVEFAKAKPGVLQQQWERVRAWLLRHLQTSSTLQGAGPWLRILLECVLFGLPLLLLGLWLLRQVREDRLRPRALPKDGAGALAGVVPWADLAQAHAANHAWRDAVHALYWQAVTALEQRRVWSVVRHRTPREYLRLLEAGSRRRTLLRELTFLLEHVWYGQGNGTEQDFLRALHLTRELATG